MQIGRVGRWGAITFTAQVHSASYRQWSIATDNEFDGVSLSVFPSFHSAICPSICPSFHLCVLLPVWVCCRTSHCHVPRLCLWDYFYLDLRPWNFKLPDFDLEMTFTLTFDLELIMTKKFDLDDLDLESCPWTTLFLDFDLEMTLTLTFDLEMTFSLHLTLRWPWPRTLISKQTSSWTLTLTLT